MNNKREELSDRFLDFAVLIIQITAKLPNTSVGNHIKGQLMRSGTSSGSNYKEACGAESRKDFRHKLGVVLKELRESRFWLRLIHRSAILPDAEVKPVLEECEELCAIIGKSIVTSKKRQ